jgi:hypothetical protein
VNIRAGLIDSGAAHNIVGRNTLDIIMGSLGMSRAEKCQPQSPIHRFGAHGASIEPDFGIIIPWDAKDMNGQTHSFNLRADVLEGDHPLLIGCPTLVSMKASLDFDKILLKATINGRQCSMKLMKCGNHLFLENHMPPSNLVPVSPAEQSHESYYGSNDHAWTQLFPRPDHC